MPGGFCSKCGGVIEGTDRFCGGCGAPVDAAAVPTVSAAVPTIPTPVSPTPATHSPHSWANLSQQARGGIVAVVVAVAVGGVMMLTNSDKDGTPTTTPATVQTSTSTVAVATTDTDTDLSPGVPYSAYETITDESGILQVSVPVEWTDRNGATWNPSTDDVPVGPGLQAAPNLVAWTEGWSTPGMFFGASIEPGLTADELLDRLSFEDFCDFDSRDDYDDGLYRGKAAAWVNCGDAGSRFAQIAAEPYEGGALMLVEVIVVSQADLGALQKIVESFQMTADLGG